MKNNTPHIGIYGKTNVGKSSFINAITNQNIAIVSEIAGTTTDPVRKSLEITNLGPVILIDTAGIEDKSELGTKRIAATIETIKQIDLAIIVIENSNEMKAEAELIEKFEKHNTPFFIIQNKSDLIKISQDEKQKLSAKFRCEIMEFSSKTNENFENIFEAIKRNLPNSIYNNPSVLGDLVKAGDIVLLITPIDIEAPKGRLILPQVQTIRDLLDNDCTAIVLKEREVDAFLKNTKIKPNLVVTDSQVFLKAAGSIPQDIPLTSFSILFARLKGDFESYISGTRSISKLQNGDKILILESCSHHVAGDDIGRVKIPRWLTNFTGKNLEYEVVAGLNNPKHNINDYKLVIQCGGCMLTRKQIINRIKPAIDAGVPVTNYGLAIAYCLGIFERAIKPFTPKSESNHIYM